MQKSLPFFIFSVFSVLLFSLFSCRKQEQNAVLTLVMAEVNPEDTIVGCMDTAFKEKVEELSDGKMKIDLHCSGILGDETQVMKLVMSPNSSIQLVRGPANLSSYSNGYTVKSSLIAIPYTFKDDEHFWKFANSDVAELILNEPYELGLGIKGLFYAEEGFRHYFSRDKISTVADLKDKKMRVSGNVLTALAQSFGSIPVEVNYTDLYASLQMGTTEVAEQPITNYLSNSFYHVAPYMILDGHMLGAVSVMINAQCWDSLSQTQRKILHEAGRYASDYCRKIVSELNEQARKTLKSEGVTFTEVTDNASWQDACSKMRKDAAVVDPVLYQQILDLAK